MNKVLDIDQCPKCKTHTQPYYIYENNVAIYVYYCTSCNIKVSEISSNALCRICGHSLHTRPLSNPSQWCPCRFENCKCDSGWNFVPSNSLTDSDIEKIANRVVDILKEKMNKGNSK